MFEIIIENLGSHLWQRVNLPMDAQELNKIVDHIANAFPFEGDEVVVTDIDTGVDGLDLGELDNVFMLNYLADRLENEDIDLEKLAAAALNLIDSLDNFALYEDIETDSDLGEYYAKLTGLDLDSILGRYFDFDAYGRDIRLEADGSFTEWGWFENMDGIEENYNDISDLPEDFQPKAEETAEAI